MLSNFIAPAVAGSADVNHYYFLSWGAPALFHEEIDEVGAMVKLEPWRLLGLQLPAFAGIDPGQRQEVVVPPLIEPVSPQPAPVLSGSGVVGIYHSHTSEAFRPTSGKDFTTDFSLTVVELGKIIAERLESEGIRVVHNQTYHNSKIGNSQSYEKSRVTMSEMLTQEPGIILFLDVHRDGFDSNTTEKKARAVTTATIEGKKAGKILFVVSSAHEDWQKNQRVANDLHNIIEDKYPGLSRGILIRTDSVFNQDFHPNAILVEVGCHWNSLEEAIYGAQLFADALVQYLGGYSE